MEEINISTPFYNIMSDPKTAKSRRVGMKISEYSSLVRINWVVILNLKFLHLFNLF